MKELTIEEKAKSFNEALSRAKGFYKRFPEHKDILEKIFPELKESEGERIWIINYLSNRILNSIIIAEKENLKKAIAWLEKQGEQKPNYCHHEVDLSGCSEEYRKAYYDGWNNCNQQHEQLKAEQKLWSEEDEELLLKLSQCCDLNKTQVQWLLSLKDRVRQQNGWKPSEEMLEALNDINITGCISYAGQGQELISLYNELKRLREE